MIYTFLRGVECGFRWNWKCLPMVEMVGKFRMLMLNCGFTLLWRIQRYVWHICLLMSRQSAWRCRLCAWQGSDSSHSPSSSGGVPKRGRDVDDGWEAFFSFFFLKGSITGCRMGGIRIETSVMWQDRQEHTSLVSRCQAEGALAGRTLPSLSWVREGSTGERRSGGTVVPSRPSGLRFPVSLAPFKTTEIHICCHETYNPHNPFISVEF